MELESNLKAIVPEKGNINRMDIMYQNYKMQFFEVNYSFELSLA